MADAGYFDIVFDCTSDYEKPKLVAIECESEENTLMVNESFKVSEWTEREDGSFSLRITEIPQ